MSKIQDRFDAPIPANARCALCGQSTDTVNRVCLIGTGDHPRYFFLCGECIGNISAISPGVERPRAAPSPAMTEQEKRIESRRQQRFDRLGTDDPQCALCLETDSCCMELHHLAGKNFEKTLMTVCRNCHRKLSDAQIDHPAKCGEPPTTIENIGHFLLGLADMLALLVVKLRDFGTHLITQATSHTLVPKPA